MDASYHRHDISDETWNFWKSIFPAAKAPEEAMPEMIGNSSTLFLDSENWSAMA